MLVISILLFNCQTTGIITHTRSLVAARLRLGYSHTVYRRQALNLRWLAVCAIGLVACTPARPARPFAPATPTPTFSPNFVDPYLVTKGLYSDLNNGDMPGAMSYFASNAVYIVPKGPAEGLYLGTDEIQRLLQPDLDNHIFSVISNFEDGYDVFTLTRTRIQAAQLVSSEVVTFSVIDGKITGVGVDPESLIRYFFNAFNENRGARGMSLFADDPVCLLAAPAPLDGKPAIQSALQAYVSAGDSFEVSDVQAVEYYKVTWTLKIYNAQGKVIADVRRLSGVQNGRIQDCRLPDAP
jgi:hypothetical protein